METDIRNILNFFCKGRGFEVAPFNLGWYNEALNSDKFKLTIGSDDSLSYVIISEPSMFEKTFLPFVKENWSDIVNNAIQDPLDQCMKQVFTEMLSHLLEFDQEAVKLHDFELHPNRRPKILVQTAGHVSGAVRFYQQSDADKDLLEMNNNSKLYPVCLHPKYGGWFALRGVIILPNIKVPNLQRKEPPNVLKSEKEISHLLNLYNHHWQDGRFRDCGPNKDQKYSENQQNYFAHHPGPQRLQFLNNIMNL